MEVKYWKREKLQTDIQKKCLSDKQQNLFKTRHNATKSASASFNYCKGMLAIKIGCIRKNIVTLSGI